MRNPGRQQGRSRAKPPKTAASVGVPAPIAPGTDPAVANGLPVRSGVRRESILERVFRERGPSLTLFQGPAGHGKTTLLHQARALCTSRGIRCCGLSFEEADNDQRRFFTRLQDAILPSIDEEPESLASAAPVFDRRSHAPRSEWLVARLLTHRGAVALFFDEFQALKNPAILAFFCDLIEHLPAGVRLFLGSRTIPEIGIPRLVVNDRAQVVRADELRFSAGEAAQFFAEGGDLQLTRAEIEAIHRQTDGWPAALQLFRLSLSNPEVRRALDDLSGYKPRELAEYLADNVLSMQPPDVQAFVLRAGLLARLSAPLCDAVTGQRDSQAMLDRLERAGLFLRAVDAQRRWFRFHALFAGFLGEQLQLREDGEEIAADVHRRAAHWFAGQALFEEAMHHALATGDAGFAADLFQRWTPQLVSDGNIRTVEHWYERLPFAEVEKRPDLVVKVAWALTFLRRHRKLLPLLRLLEREAAPTRGANASSVVRSMIAILQDDLPRALRAVGPVKVETADAEGFRAFELGAAANLKGYVALARGDFELAHRYLAQARAHGERARSPFSWGYSISTTGVNLMIQAQHQDALERFRLGAAEPRVYLDESSASASLMSCHIQALYEVNDLDAAEALFRQFRGVIAETALLDYLAVGFISMVRIHDAHGRAAKAAELLAETENLGHANAWPRLVRIVAWERVRRALAQGDLDAARAIAGHLDAARAVTWLPFAEDSEGDAVGETRLALASGGAARARAIIAREQRGAAEQGRIRRQIRLGILDALACAQLGETTEAVDVLLRALRLAAPGGLSRAFLEEDLQRLPDLLRRCERLSTSEAASFRRFMAGLVAALPAGASAAAAPVARLDSKEAVTAETLFEPLTDRESRLLGWLAKGVSNREIAARLFVSENTVKFHLKNIYAKFGVCSRLQAINAARRLGVLDDQGVA